MNNSDISINLENRYIVSINIKGKTYKTTIKNIRAILKRDLSILELNDNNNPAFLIYFPENSNFLLVKSLKTQKFIQLPLSKIDAIISKWKSILETDFGHHKTLEELEQLDELEENKLKQKKRSWFLESDEWIRTEREWELFLSSRWGSNKSFLELERLEEQYEIFEEQRKGSERSERLKKEREKERNEMLEKKFGFGKSLQELEDLELEEDRIKSHQLIDAEKVIKKMEDEETQLRREMFG
jgi:hypothetical protein